MRYKIILVISALLSICRSVDAGPTVNIVVGPTPPKLVRFAADEMASQLQGLFEADVSITTEPSEGAEHIILLGNPKTNPTIASSIGAFWPKLSNQGHLLRTVRLLDQRPVLVVGGGSDTSTMWAAYELGHRFGIRYLLSGDVLPANAPPFSLDDFDVLLEPLFETRGWEVLDSSPEGFGGWGLDDYQRLIRQLAKLKYNRLHLKGLNSVNSPYLRYDFLGAEVQDSDVVVSPRLQITGDAAGRRAFLGAKEFINPVFSGKRTRSELIEAGIGLVQGITEAGHERGFDILLELSPYRFPLSWKSFLEKEKNIGLTTLTEAEDGIEINSGNISLRSTDLISNNIEHCLQTYPGIDGLVLHVPEDERMALARQLREMGGFRSTADEGSWHPFVLRDATLSELRPAGLRYSELQTKALELLTKRDAPDKVDRLCRLPLMSQSDHCPSSGISDLHARTMGDFTGFLVDSGMAGDHSPMAFGFARQGFDAELTSDQALNDFFLPFTASTDVCARCIQAMQLIAAADLLGPAVELIAIDNEATLLNQFQRALRRHRPPNSILLREKLNLYTKATDEFYRAHDGCHPRGRPTLYYHCKRGEFAIHYLSFAEAMIAAGEAKRKKDLEGRSAQLEKALESIYNACTAMSEIARDPSDRGLIAVLNEYAYRPLKKLIEEEEEGNDE